MPGTNTQPTAPQMPQSNPVQPQMPVSNQPDPMAQYLNIVKKNPGKTAYIATLVVTILLTVFPWFEGYKENLNYFSYVGINFFTILYLLALVDLIAIRIILWKNMNVFPNSKKVLEYIEVVEVGAILMFILTLGTRSVQFGLILSLLGCLGILGYITYDRLFKKH